jgi:sulfide:quinone oxidoreductase
MTRRRGCHPEKAASMGRAVADGGDAQTGEDLAMGVQTNGNGHAGPDVRRVLIAGGGVAAIEAALALRDICGDRVRVEIFSPQADFVYRPYSVGEPYGAAQVKRYELDDLVGQCGAEFHLAGVGSVEPEKRLLVTHDGERHTYDHLILAQGTRSIWPVPGAITFWGIADDRDVDWLLRGLRKGEMKSVAFTMASRESWSLPLYELALLADRQLIDAGIDDVKMTIVTPEDAPLQIFGRGVSERVSALLAERAIEVVSGTHPVRFEDRALQIAPGGEFEVDVAISLPKLEGRKIPGVPHDHAGFIRIDDRCRVLGFEHLFAAGDVTNFPVKQGGVATQQADLIAEAIGAELGLNPIPAPLDPVLRGVLWTGEKPLYLEGRLGGGHGETSTLSEEPRWGGPGGKIVGKYLTQFLASAAA